MSASTVIISLSFHLPKSTISVNACLCNCYLVSINILPSSLPTHFLRSENSQICKHFSITEEQFWDGSVVKDSKFGGSHCHDSEAHSARM